RFNFVLYRPIQLVPVLIGISLVTFLLIHAIPGDPARLLLGAKATPEAIAAIHARFGLDKPVAVQYLYFLVNLLRGELGLSIIYKAPVLQVVVGRILPTLFLLLYAVALAVSLSVVLGSAAAANRGRPLDQAIRLFSTVGLGLPAFWLGIVLIMLLSIDLGWFPVSGYGEDFPDRLHHLFLPAFTVAFAMAPVLTRNLRASLIAESTADYVSAARAKGLPRHVIFFHHIFRNSMIPTINLLGVNVGWLIGGTVVVEAVFSVPGLGGLLVSSIFARDYLVVQAVTLILALGVVATNFIVDIATVALDPRIQP
ncbi:MAG TPA: ABC transporter permease, partial [Dongiaceae bacterium]|nr:ABC transporter permease [Dongiaceae bacterium]